MLAKSVQQGGGGEKGGSGGGGMEEANEAFAEGDADLGEQIRNHVLDLRALRRKFEGVSKYFEGLPRDEREKKAYFWCYAHFRDFAPERIQGEFPEMEVGGNNSDSDGNSAASIAPLDVLRPAFSILTCLVSGLVSDLLREPCLVSDLLRVSILTCLVSDLLREPYFRRSASESLGACHGQTAPRRCIAAWIPACTRALGMAPWWR